MALYSEHLDDIIYKSSFTVGIKDAFVSPTGEIIMADSFCHCQLASDIIKELTLDHDRQLKKYEKEIRRIELYLSKNNDTDMKYTLENMKAQYDEISKHDTCVDLFDAIHLNKGYDEAEFIVAYLGYIGIEGNYLLYNRKMVSGSQLKALGLSYHYENSGKIIEKDGTYN